MDLDGLRQIAEDAIRPMRPGETLVDFMKEMPKRLEIFNLAANPKTVIDLIDEIEALRRVNDDRYI